MTYVLILFFRSRTASRNNINKEWPNVLLWN